MNNYVSFEETITDMRNDGGERIYRCDGKAHIKRIHVSRTYQTRLEKLFHIKGVKHEHEYEDAQYSTGGGWSADVYECQICTQCGKIIDWKKVY